MATKRFLSRQPLNEDMTLQITSMADIFTILLVFLLKTFSTGVSNISPGHEIVLPDARTSDEVIESLKIEVAPNTIVIDDKPVTVLHNFRFESTDVERDGTARSLNTALMKERRKRPATVERTPAGEPPPDAASAARVMVLADQKTPYATLRAVLNSASNSGFTEFKLVIVKEE